MVTFPTPDTFVHVINSYLPEPHSSLLNGLIFGIPLKHVHDFYEKVQRVGLLHLVVLSGTNITFLATGIAYVTRFFSKQVSLMITVISIVLFVCFVGPQAPIVRAAIMGILTFVAIMFGRRSYAWYSLILSLIGIAVFKSEWLTSVSLYLSYGATIGMLLFPTGNGNYLKNELQTTFSAQLFTVPIIIFTFHQLSLIAPLANIAVSFTVPPLMLFGFLTALLGYAHPLLGLLPSYLCFGLLSYDIFVIEQLSKLPFAFIQW
jgi:competence protein ComEC